MTSSARNQSSSPQCQAMAPLAHLWSPLPGTLCWAQGHPCQAESLVILRQSNLTAWFSASSKGYWAAARV